MKKLALFLVLALSAFADSKIVRNTMGGNIDVDSAPGGAVLRTMGGDIRVDQASGEVVAKTMGGNIRVRRLNGSIEAGTMGGSVDVEVLGAGSGRAIELTSLGGDVELLLPKNFAADFEVELESDDDDRRHEIISDFPLKVTETTRRRWFKKVSVQTATGRSGNAANRVRISTIGGDIYIRSK